MMTRLAPLALPLLAVAALATPAAASELALDMQFVAPGAPYTGDQTPIDSAFTMVLSYNFDPHVWTGVTLTLTLPNKGTHPRIAIGTTAEPAATFAQGQIITGAADTIKWVGTPAANTGISGQIVVTLTAESWPSGAYGPAIDGTPYTFSATLTGTADGGTTPESATTSGTRTGVGKAVVAWQYPGSLYGAVQTKPHETNAGRGVMFRYNYRYTNCGSNPVDANSSVVVDLGSGLQLARHWAGGNGAVYPAEFAGVPDDGPLNPPGNNGEIWSTTPGTPAQISVNHPYQLPGYPSCAYTNNYYVELWASCESLATLRQRRQQQPVGDLTPWQLQGRAYATEPHWGQPSTPATAPLVGSVAVIPDVACGDLEPFVKSGDHNPPASTNLVSLGATKDWYMAFGLPVGVSAVKDFLFVDVLPMRGTRTIVYKASDFLATLAPYFCTLTPNTYFDASAVPGFIASGACKPAVTYQTWYWQADPSQSIEAVSHFILYGDYTATGDVGFYRNAMYAYTEVPSNIDVSLPAGGNILRNHAYITGKADLDLNTSTPDQVFGDTVMESSNEDLYEDQGSVRVVDYACPQTYFHPDYFGPRTLAPGDCSWAFFITHSNQPFRPSKNMTMEMTVPDGAIVQDVEFAYGTSPCTENPDVGVTEPAPPYDSPLVWQFGESGADCSQPYSQSPFHVRVYFCTDPNHAYANGDQLNFNLDIADYTYAPVPPDNCNGYSQHSLATFTMLVPAEMSETVAPVCREDGDISFKASAINTGGIDLVHVVPMFTLPRAATGSDADTIYQGITNVVAGAQAYVIEGSPDGNTWTANPAPGDASIRYVRLRGTGPSGLQIAAVTGSAITYDVLVSSAGSAGSELFGGGTLDGATATGPLATANAAANQPYVIDGCKELTITKFFDADSDGTADGDAAGEPVLAGFTFSITNEDGAEVATATTDATGRATVLVSVGDYTVTELAHATPPSTWSVTTPANAVADSATEVTLTLAMPSLTVAFGNVCTCPDRDDDLCTGRCLPDGSCDDAYQVSCVDPSSCTADSCNPDTGLCEHVGKDCTAVDYYLPVEDAQGVAIGTIHCVFEPGEDPICDQGEDGKLRVWPLDTPTMQSCESKPQR